MPLYEYRCKSCYKHFETLRTFGQKDAPAPCPACGGQESMRLLSVFAATVSEGKSSGCETSAAMGMPCCGGGCGLPMRR